jgi:hypothetical protein
MAASIALSPALGLPQRTIITAMPDVSRHSNASDLFYASLPVFVDFAGVAQPERYRELPDDWHVAVADVEGSTNAVRAGRYKDVNLLGASCITSVLNATRPVEIPYIFGGDGATMCVPPSQIEATRAALLATQRLARDEFQMRLRIGMVPVELIRKAGHRVEVARFRASDNYIQASFTGGGVQFAERCVKDDERGRAFRFEFDATTTAGDFSGLECRWNSIPSPHGEVVTLLVQATTGDPARDARVYADAIQTIESVYAHAGELAPVREQDLSLTLDRRKLMSEARVQVAGKGWLRQALYTLWAQGQSILGRVLLAKGLTIGGIDWGKYRQDVIANTDYRKFDDVLRHVLSGTPAQRDQLAVALEQRYQKGELVYGIHHAPSALMTCFIFARNGGHVHFVDGADGGYTMAAADLKRRLLCKLPQPV